MPGAHPRLLVWEDVSCEEPHVHLCRECEALLWHRHASCPSCRAQRPHAWTPAVPAATTAHGRLAVAIALAALVASAAVDQALLWLLVST